MLQRLLGRANSLRSLAALFEQDCRLVLQLNETARRLQSANGRLWSGLHPDAIALVYEDTDRLAISRGASVIAGIVTDAIRARAAEQEVETAVLAALQKRTGRSTAPSPNTRPHARSVATWPSPSENSLSSSPTSSPPLAGRPTPHAP